MVDETYEFKSWERFDLDLINATSGNPGYFLILDHEFDDSDPDITPDTDNNILYSGFSPNSKVIALNEILVQYIIKNNFYNIGATGWADPNPVFYLYCTIDDWENWYSYELKITYDWTYDYNIGYRDFLSNPISNVMDYRQYFICTFQQSDPTSTVLERYDIYIDGVINEWGLSVLNNSGTIRLLVQDIITWTGTDINYEVYSPNSTHFSGIITDTCKRYCIYYLNRLGGWDWLLIDGKNLKTDKMSRLTYKRNYWPQNQASMNKVPYVNTITENFEFTTSWMKDIDAEKITDLIESNKVVVHDLVENIIYPVIMTNSSVEYKTYKNQGRKLYSYTLNMESSRPKYRIDTYENYEPDEL